MIKLTITIHVQDMQPITTEECIVDAKTFAEKTLGQSLADFYHWSKVCRKARQIKDGVLFCYSWELC